MNISEAANSLGEQSFIRPTTLLASIKVCVYSSVFDSCTVQHTQTHTHRHTHATSQGLLYTMDGCQILFTLPWSLWSWEILKDARKGTPPVDDLIEGDDP